MFLKAKPFLFILTAVFIVTGCRSDQQKIESYMTKGNQYFNEKAYKKAEIEVKNVLQINPELTGAWLLLGKILMQTGDPKNAFHAYSKVEELDPQNQEALLKTAGFYLLGNQVDKGRKRIEKILETHPDNIQALLLKAQILTHEKENNNAASVFNQVLTLEPGNIKALQGLARIRSFQNNFKEAESLLLEAVSQDDTAVQPRLALVSFYISRREFKKAEDQLSQASLKNPDNVDLQIILGNFYFRMRDQILAEKAYLKAVDISPENLKPYMTAAGFYDTMGKEDKALEMYEKALSLKPDNLSVKNTLARFHYKNKNIDAAEALVKEILDKRPGFYAAKMLKSEIFVYKKEFDQALKLLGSLEKQEPKDPRLHYFKGLCHIGLGRNEQARASVARAVELKPEYLKARLLLADIHYHERNFDMALSDAAEVLKLDTDNYRAVMIHSNSLLHTGDVSQAEKGFQSLIDIDPENPAGYYRMGLLRFLQKKYSAAEDFLNQALSKNPMLMDVFVLLVRNAAADNNLEKAHTLCRKQLETVKDNPSLAAYVYAVQGGIYAAQKDMENAKKSYNLAIQTHPEFLKPYMALARIHLMENNKKEAIAKYQAILDKKPLAMPHMMIGTILDMDKEYEKAAEHYKKALEINPDFAPAANNLAYHLAERTDQYNKALEYARIAKKRLPEDPGVMDTLGLVFYKKGLYGNAVNEFLDALKKIPDNPIVHFHLGLAYSKKGEPDLARKALEKALQLQSDFEGHEQAKEILARLKKS